MQGAVLVLRRGHTRQLAAHAAVVECRPLAGGTGGPLGRQWEAVALSGRAAELRSMHRGSALHAAVFVGAWYGDVAGAGACAVWRGGACGRLDALGQCCLHWWMSWHEAHARLL